jgi:uncharacterized protein (TIGR02145 family)
MDDIGDYLGGYYVAGGKMKTTGTTQWHSPNTDATNSSGFSGVPGGFRNGTGPFNGIGDDGSWWSSSEYDAGTALLRDLGYTHGHVFGGSYDEDFGCSVRCVRD